MMLSTFGSAVVFVLSDSAAEQGSRLLFKQTDVHAEVLQLVHGVDSCHKAGLVNMDLKPEAIRGEFHQFCHPTCWKGSVPYFLRIPT